MRDESPRTVHIGVGVVISGDNHVRRANQAKIQHIWPYSGHMADAGRMTDEHRINLKTLQAIIFDLDDTLIVSTIDFSKFKRNVIDKMVVWGEDASLYSLNETIVAILARFERRCRDRGLDDDEIRSRLEELNSIMDDVELDRVEETRVIEGAPELLEMLRRRKVKVGILTRGCEEYASRALSTARISDLVDAVECRNSKTKAKPDPESYFKLTRALGIRADRTLFVGDHPIDAQCAKNAGVPFVAVLTGDVPENRLRDAGSVMVFRDVRELRNWIERALEE